MYDAETHKQAIIDASQMRPSMLNEEDEEATSKHYIWHIIMQHVILRCQAYLYV